ncbi:MAG: hypothetical protein Q7S22_00690 [Candidatus Micrarchaeota archaeon]|nr:hypothetical protein [Candidatus Micrarchaeota archaeon]
MAKNILFLLFFLSTLVLFGCTQGTTQAGTTSTLNQGDNLEPSKAADNVPYDYNKINYESKVVDNQTNVTTYFTDKFSIVYLKSWQNVKIEKDNIFFILAAPFENDTDQLRESINLGVDILHNGETIEAFAVRALSKSQGGPSLASMKSAYTNLGNRTLYRILYPPAKFNDLEIVSEQTFVPNGNIVYIFTYTAETKSFFTYYNATNDVISSFKINQ